MHLNRITYFLHWQRQNDVEMPGFEPGAFHMRSERSTTELHPRAYYLGIADPSKLPSALCPTFCSKNIEIQNEIKKALLRFELRISCLLDRRFNQLSHGANIMDSRNWFILCQILSLRSQLRIPEGDSNWLVGLGVWFSLRVREVPGSNPGGAHPTFLIFSKVV